MRLRLPSACQPGCALCAEALGLDEEALPLEGLEAKLEHAERTNRRRIYLQGTDLALNPHLPTIVRSAKRRSLAVALIEEGSGLRLPDRAQSLQRLGVSLLYLSLHGVPAASRDPGAQPADPRKQALGVLLALHQGKCVRVGVHVALSQRSARELPAVLRLQARLSIRELLVSDAVAEDGTPPLDAAAAVAALDRVWLAANALQLRLRCIGFERTRHVNLPIGEPAPACDISLLDIIREGISLPSPRAGIQGLGGPERPSQLAQLARSTDELKQLALELAARRYPFVDIPPCLGGALPSRAALPAGPPASFLKFEACRTCPFDERCPGAPAQLESSQASSLQSALRPLPTWYSFRHPPNVLILSSQGQDPVFYSSTLPALAAALKKRGAAVEIVSPWLSRWSADVPPALNRNGHVPDWTGTTGVEAWLSEHDLGGFDLVITSDFPTARLALAAKSLGAAVRIVVLDFHMLKGMDDAVAGWLAPGARPFDGGWWPSDRLILESAFPGYVKLYLSYGVPLEQVAWRPFALYPGHFPPGPDVHQCDVIMSGGNHLRDLETLRAATERLPASVHPVDLYAPGESFDGNAHLRHKGYVLLDAFYSALASSRFVVVPLQEDTNRAAGVTVLAMALMAGRPIIATGIAAIRDYVQHGTEGLLVPPGDPEALADAITRLDTDPALLTTLAEGARLAGERLSTEHWAEQIVSGVPPLAPIWTPRGWRNW